MLFYYVILFSCLTVLGHFGLVIFNIKINKPLQTLGLLLITFSFFIAVGLSSAYVQYVATGSFTGASNIYYQCEDGSVFWLWSQLIPLTTDFNITLAWVMSYGVTPFMLTLIGGYLTFEKPRLSL